MYLRIFILLLFLFNLFAEKIEHTLSFDSDLKANIIIINNEAEVIIKSKEKIIINENISFDNIFRPDINRKDPEILDYIVSNFDFNFDGVKDLGVIVGYQGGAYCEYEHTKIFLNKDGEYIYNKEASEETKKSCSCYFDLEKKRLLCEDHSCGGSYRDDREYIFDNYQLKKIRQYKVDFDACSGSYNHSSAEYCLWNIGEKESCIRKYNADNSIFTLNIKNKLVHFNFYEKDSKKYLFYIVEEVISDKELKKIPTFNNEYNKHVAFIYPEDDTKVQNDNFIYYTKDDNKYLSFKNKDASYEIFENNKDVGIKIITKGEEYLYKGSKDEKSSLDNILKEKFANLTVK